MWLPLLFSRALLFIHSIYNSLHLLIPIHSSPNARPLDNYKSVLYVLESVFVV